MEIFNGIVSILDKLLNIVNSWRRLLILAALMPLTIAALFLYKVVTEGEVAAEVGSPQIERVSGWCYQQRVRSDRRIVAAQFPIPDYLVELGVKQNLAALVIIGKVDQNRFDQLCNGLLAEISQPRIRQFEHNPGLQKTLQQFYRDLDNPEAIRPLKKSDIKKESK